MLNPFEDFSPDPDYYLFHRYILTRYRHRLPYDYRQLGAARHLHLCDGDRPNVRIFEDLDKLAQIVIGIVELRAPYHQGLSFQ